MASQAPQAVGVTLSTTPQPIPVRHPTGGTTNFILVRHGRTDGNVRRVLVGRTDIPLDPLGARQAEAVGQYLAGKQKPDLIIASPLIRAQHTAQAIASKFDLPIELDPDVMELNFGNFEGFTLDQIKREHPEFASTLGDVEFDRHWPGGERLSEFHQRVNAAFIRIATTYDNHTVIVVSHGGVLGSFASQLLGTPPNDWSRYQIQNCSVTHVEFGVDGSVIHCLNDVDHLFGLDSGLEP